MLLRKLSSLLLILLILNLNMVVPAVSYATAEETCACHLNNADHQCHCDDGCKSCGMQKDSGQGSGVSGQSKHLKPETQIKGQSCSTSTQGDGSIVPVSAIPFMVPVFCDAVPMVQVSSLSPQSENILHSISKAPAKKPPMA